MTTTDILDGTVWLSIGTVKQAVVDCLTNRLAAQVSYGPPGDTVERSTVWVGNVTGNLHIPLLRASRKPREETYALEVVFDAVIPGGEPSDADLEVLTNLQALDDYLADDPSNPGVLAATLGQFSLIDGLEPQGSWARLTISIDIMNRLP